MRIWTRFCYQSANKSLVKTPTISYDRHLKTNKSNSLGEPLFVLLLVLVFNKLFWFYNNKVHGEHFADFEHQRGCLSNVTRVLSFFSFKFALTKGCHSKFQLRYLLNGGNLINLSTPLVQTFRISFPKGRDTTLAYKPNLSLFPQQSACLVVEQIRPLMKLNKGPLAMYSSVPLPK